MQRHNQDEWRNGLDEIIHLARRIRDVNRKRNAAEKASDGLLVVELLSIITDINNNGIFSKADSQ